MVHLTNNCFNQQMAKLSGIWPSEFKSAERLKRYYNALCDLPDEAFCEIVNSIIDNFRTAPLPKDFREAADEWHKTFISKNGYKYGSQKEEYFEGVIECEWCMDSGMLYCSESSDPSTQFFMLCDCKTGMKRNDDLIPHWSKQVASAYHRLPFKTKDWVPTGAITAMGLMDMWRSKIHEGRTYWANLRKKPAPIFRQFWSNEEHEAFLAHKKKQMLEDLHSKMESQRNGNQ